MSSLFIAKWLSRHSQHLPSSPRLPPFAHLLLSSSLGWSLLKRHQEKHPLNLSGARRSFPTKPLQTALSSLLLWFPVSVSWNLEWLGTVTLSRIVIITLPTAVIDCGSEMCSSWRVLHFISGNASRRCIISPISWRGNQDLEKPSSLFKGNAGLVNR